MQNLFIETFIQQVTLKFHTKNIYRKINHDKKFCQNKIK